MDDFIIDEIVIKKATKCSKKFQCLKAKPGTKEMLNFFSKSYFIEDTLSFIECFNLEHCPYQISFGNNKLCYCPVRKEIAKKYKL